MDPLSHYGDKFLVVLDECENNMHDFFSSKMFYLYLNSIVVMISRIGINTCMFDCILYKMF